MTCCPLPHTCPLPRSCCWADLGNRDEEAAGNRLLAWDDSRTTRPFSSKKFDVESHAWKATCVLCSCTKGCNKQRIGQGIFSAAGLREKIPSETARARTDGSFPRKKRQRMETGPGCTVDPSAIFGSEALFPEELSQIELSWCWSDSLLSFEELGLNFSRFGFQMHFSA